MSASYAGTLSLQSTAAAALTFSGHDLSVLSSCYIHQPVNGVKDGKKLVASGGMDRVARVWEYEVKSPFFREIVGEQHLRRNIEH